MNAAEITQRVKLDLEKQVLFDKKIAAGYYFCPRRGSKGKQHGSKFIQREGQSFFCIGKDKLGRVCYYHFKNTRGKMRIEYKAGNMETVNTISANERAKRWAMMNFDKWNEITGFIDPNTSYYDEITVLIEDAVEFGYGVALKQSLREIIKVIKNRG